MNIIKIKNWQIKLGLIFIFSFEFRLIYAFYLQKYFSGGFKYATADTSSYMDSFLNLINHGRYCFDLEIRDSCFYRLPTYSFFLGVQKYILPNYYWVSVAVLQALLDAGSCCLAVLIARKIDIQGWGLWSVAFVFIFYPFTLFWVPVQVPEIVGTFLVLLSIYLMVGVKSDRFAIIFSGLSVVLGVWSKQYIAALIPAMIFFIMARSEIGKFIRHIGLFICVVVVGYSPWVIRNFINYDEPIIFMGATPGVKAHMPDFNNAKFFVSLFYENPKTELMNIAENGKLSLPTNEFTRKNKYQIDTVVLDAYTCGPSYRIWRGESSVKKTDDCEKLVAEGFAQLSQKAKFEMPLIDYYKTAFQSFAKGFFKLDYIQSTGSATVQQLLFGYRGILIVLGLAAIFIADGRRQLAFVMGALTYWFSTLIVLSFVYRHVEMRYLLMADSVILICSCMTIGYIGNWLNERFLKMSVHRIA